MSDSPQTIREIALDACREAIRERIERSMQKIVHDIVKEWHDNPLRTAREVVRESEGWEGF